MADEIKSESTSAHQTTAANRLDPSIAADGSMNQGAGVGGQSESQIHQEGIEHIKDRLDDRGAPAETTSEPTEPATTETATSAAPVTSEEPSAPAAAAEESSSKPIETTEPPASNPGADDATAGIAKDAGGVSGTADVESPVPSQPTTATANKRKSVVGTLKGFLGLSGDKDKESKKESGAAGGDTKNAGSVGAAGAAVAGAGTAVTSALGKKDQGTKDTSLPDRSKSGDDTTAAEPTDTTTTTTSDDKMDSNTVPDPAQDGSGAGDTSADAPATSGDGKAQDLQSGANPKARENKDAIPTAGGEKLGEKHWGESKIIADNPKQGDAEGDGEEAGAGVSSAEGQPTSEVKDNTSKNTGGATGGPTQETTGGSSTPGGEKKKEKLTDKIKDKLKLGKKN